MERLEGDVNTREHKPWLGDASKAASSVGAMGEGGELLRKFKARKSSRYVLCETTHILSCHGSKGMRPREFLLLLLAKSKI